MRKADLNIEKVSIPKVDVLLTLEIDVQRKLKYPTFQNWKYLYPWFWFIYYKKRACQSVVVTLKQRYKPDILSDALSLPKSFA